ncbi:MAG: DUF4263 domain-containing protein [Anaerolineales bacterium]|nr:DUF4263 domain-containing protein [Anaerolineales bacterium]
MDKESYRRATWSPSKELVGGIAQIQKTVQQALYDVRTKFEPHADDGTPTGESVYLYQPKSYLVIGNLAEFASEFGVNEEKYSSFELFRRNITNPEIVTYDELFERCKFIVGSLEADFIQESTDEFDALSPPPDDDIPF